MRADQNRASGVGWYLVALSFAIGATPAVQRGHALSAYNAGFMGFVPAGAFVVAALAAVAGIRWALMVPGLLIVMCAAGLLSGRMAGRRAAADRGPRTLPARRSQSAASHQQPRRLTWYRQARR